MKKFTYKSLFKDADTFGIHVFQFWRRWVAGIKTVNYNTEHFWLWWRTLFKLLSILKYRYSSTHIIISVIKYYFSICINNNNSIPHWMSQTFDMCSCTFMYLPTTDFSGAGGTIRPRWRNLLFSRSWRPRKSLNLRLTVVSAFLNVGMVV